MAETFDYIYGDFRVMRRNKREHYTGCLLGGAVGDALGTGVHCVHDEINRHNRLKS